MPHITGAGFSHALTGGSTFRTLASIPNKAISFSEFA